VDADRTGPPASDQLVVQGVDEIASVLPEEHPNWQGGAEHRVGVASGGAFERLVDVESGAVPVLSEERGSGACDRADEDVRRLVEGLVDRRVTLLSGRRRGDGEHGERGEEERQDGEDVGHSWRVANRGPRENSDRRGRHPRPPGAGQRACPPFRGTVLRASL